MLHIRSSLISVGICLLAGSSGSVPAEQEPATNVGGKHATTPANGNPMHSAQSTDAWQEMSSEKETKQSSETENQDPDEWYRLFRERMKNPVRLGKIPQIGLQERSAISVEQARKIRELIAALSAIDRPDYGFSSTMSGQAFLPVDGQSESTAFVITDHGLESSSALRELVGLGPDALPLLLEALDDQTPTKIKLEYRSAMGMMWFDQEMWGNPLNLLEAQTLKMDDESAEVNGREEYVEEYTVKVGDICFVAIGQIVGRSYAAVRYQPTACIVINSPTHDPELASKVRKIWSSEKPREFLFQSLLRDYSSIGIYHGDSLDVWDVGSRLQCNAALRLLYYYPNESGKLIADRLRSLDVEDTDGGTIDRFIEREVKNGVRTEDFVHAVSWSRIAAVRDAVTELFLRTTDDDVLLAALPGVDDPRDEIIPQRLHPLLEQLPPDEGPIYGWGWKLLLAWTKASPRTARNAMEEYIKNGVTQRLQSACAVLSDTSPVWKVQFLRPFLDDTRDLKSWTSSETREVNGEEIKIRLCDMAAYVLAEEDKTLSFKLEGPVDEVDRQIATIRQELDRRRNGK